MSETIGKQYLLNRHVDIYITRSSTINDNETVDSGRIPKTGQGPSLLTNTECPENIL
jgi:hypothetical protein